MDHIERLEQRAVDAAVHADWETAANLNREILTHDEQNLSASLRLGFAYMQLKKFTQARTFYNKALALQPSNLIAQENLEKIKLLRSQEPTETNKIILNPSLFLEIPGKTKSITLVNLGQRDILAGLVIGQEVRIKPKKRKIEIRTDSDEYIGTLPDDISRRLLVFIEADSEYSAFIKEATLNKVVIFMREDKKGGKMHAHISFTQSIQPEALPEATTDTEDGEAHEEEDEKDHIEAMAETLLERESEEQINIQTSEEEEAEEE